VRFPGQYLDAETGLDYNRHRYYSSVTGRYVSSDPLLQASDTNIFAYARHNAENETDPSGLLDFGDAINMRLARGPVDPTGGDIVDRAVEAQNEAFAPYYGETPDPYGGAYRHCVAACLAKRRYGSIIGNMIVLGWDHSSENPDDYNSRGDMDGEQCGLDAADGPDSCKNGCLGFFPVPPLSYNPRVE
jgi:RHS repeat-associated protein